MGLLDNLENETVGLDDLEWLDQQLKMNIPEYEFEGVEDFEEETPQALSSYVRLSEDHMHAWLYLQERENDYSKLEIIRILNDNGVVRGIDQNMIIAMIRKHVYEQEIEIACGKEAEEGKEGTYEYFFDTETKKKPRILEDGSVDYTSMSELTNVSKDQMIAKYHPAEEGMPGYTVDNTEIPVGRTKELPILKGKGFYQGEVPGEYFAQKDGKISLRDGRIDIAQVHQIRGDVDMITGKIEFYGDIEITGSVGAGVVIRAGRNVTIHGSVGSAMIYAGGDVVLKRGIQGGGRAKVVAKGNIYAEFIEYSSVSAGENVEANSTLSSEISAQGVVKVDGSKGTIVGGYTHGLKGVVCKTAGNDVEVKTVIHAGYEKETYQKHSLLKQKELEAVKLIGVTQDRISELQKDIKLRNIPRYRLSEMEKEVETLSAQRTSYTELLNKIKEEYKRLEIIIEEGRGSKIQVEDKVYRGVIVGTEKAQYIIERTVTNKTFYLQSGAVYMH